MERFGRKGVAGERMVVWRWRRRRRGFGVVDVEKREVAIFEGALLPDVWIVGLGFFLLTTFL